MNPALALERIMLHPAYDDLVQLIRAATPAHERDQVDASARDAHQLLTIAADAAGGTHRHGATLTDLPGWLRLGLLDTMGRWLTGRADTCRHLPHPDRPEPVVAAAWRPGLVACAACSHLVAVGDGTRRGLTCDCCGHVCAGPDDDDGIYPGLVQLGPMIYQYGTCERCRTSVGPLNATETAEQDTAGGTGRVRLHGRGEGPR